MALKQQNTPRLEFSSVSELQATEKKHFVDDDEIYLQGIISGSTTGCGRFRYDASDTGTDDGATIIEPTGAGAGRFLRIFGPIFHAEEFGVVADGVTDDRAAGQLAADAAAGGTLKWPAGDIYISNPGITLTGNDHNWVSDGGTQLLCERTHFSDEGGGVYAVGQGNVINGDGITGVTIKGITIKGSYTTAWGDVGVYDPVTNTPWGDGHKLLFLKDCNDVVLDNFKITESFASYTTDGVTPTDDANVVNGYNQLLITGCDNVQLKDCEWSNSVGEAWHIYNCENVRVNGCNFNYDYGTSLLDITYCTHVNVVGNSFLKNLSSDSGDLLNVIGSDVVISGNTILNGNIDIGNEYLNRQIVLGQSFVVRNVSVDGNTITNGFIQFGTPAATFTPTWAHENVNISNNTITIDLDTRPAANGTTVLNYSGITLPYNKSSRNISVTGNNILLKGALQTGTGTPSDLNNIRLINSITSTTGFTNRNYTISNNTLLSEFSNYDSDLLNDLGGAIFIQRGIWEGLSIEGNTIESPLGIMIDREESMARTSIRHNSVKGENFLNMPYTNDTQIDGMDISDNKFKFYDASGRTYVANDTDDRGFGAFINLWVGNTDSDVLDFHVQNNTVEAVVFTFVSNVQSTTAYTVEATISDNNVKFVEFANGTPTIYPFRVGRNPSSTADSILRIVDNYFTESSTATIPFTPLYVKSLDLIGNQFIGTYSFTVTTDNISGVADSRLVMKDNMADTALTVTMGNMTTAVFQQVSGNSTNFTFGGWDKVNGVVVASLPAAATAGDGARAYVTDATATTFASTVAGSGANSVPVYSDGTNWLIG